MKTFSNHVFYFPFKWELPERAGKVFSEQTDLNCFPVNTQGNWLHNTETQNEQEANELYNERNYYYEFVHPVLYDDGTDLSIVRHYERKETSLRDVSYTITLKSGKVYVLKIAAMNLNLYATGVGMLTFYLENNLESQASWQDILNINQFGRRIFPANIGEKERRGLLAQSITIEGLNGPALTENFNAYTNESKYNWKPAGFICSLIKELSKSLIITPVIDDRMFVNCWYGTNDFKTEICGDYKKFINENDFWYQYVYVDDDGPTCQNKEMREAQVAASTYLRWQQYGTLYGISRYSFVALTEADSFIAVHMRTIYSRMIELVLVQQATSLRFSGEITRLSRLSKMNRVESDIINQISDLYKEYVRFVNQVYFREITAQDQGIELHKMLTDTLNTKSQVHDLDKEIEELYQYVNLLDDKVRNKNAELLNFIAAILLPATLWAAVFGMNQQLNSIYLWRHIGCIIVLTAIMYFIIRLIKKKK